MEYNKVRVNVCGKEFALQTEESAGYMKELAKILDDSFKTNSDIDNIRAQIASYAAETAQAMDKIDELEEKIELLNREKENLQRDLELHALRDQIQ